MRELSWEEIKIEDIERYREYYNRSLSYPSEYAPLGLFMWSDFYKLRYAFDDRICYIKEVTGEYWSPVGEWDSLSVSEWRQSIITQRGSCVKYVPELLMKILKEAVTEVRIEEDRDSWDYLYSTEDLSYLSGRKFSKKKNHLNNFLKNFPDHCVEKINEENAAKLYIEYSRYASKLEKTPFLEAEHRAIVSVLENYKKLPIEGVVIENEGIPYAFAIGERTPESYIVQIEKALVDFRGVYQRVNQGFAQYIEHNNCGIINRCDDMGVLGLRQAKESYYPQDFLKKYTLYF